MLLNAYFLAKIGADTAENEQHFANRRSLTSPQPMNMQLLGQPMQPMQPGLASGPQGVAPGPMAPGPGGSQLG